MANQTFKVKNGLTLTPVDPATLTNPQSGDLVCDSTDNNQIKRYNATSASWTVVGSGSGASDLGIAASDTADSNALADYTQTGLEILTSPTASALQLIHGTASYRLIHQSGSSRNFKKTIALDSKFRGRNLTLKLWNRSTATSGNDTIVIRDETNSTDLVSTSIQNDSAAYTVATSSGLATITFATSSDANLVKPGMSVTGAGIQTGTVVQSISGAVATLNQTATATAASVSLRFSALAAQRSYSFDVPTNCASLSWNITALLEANSPESYYDDISVEITQIAKTSTTISLTAPVVTEWTSSPTPSTNITNATLSAYQARRVGTNIEIQAAWTFTGAGQLFGIPMSALIPSGLSPDTSKMAYVTAEHIGGAYSLDSGVADYTNHVLATASASQWGVYTPTASVPFTPSSGDTVAVRVSLPIQGWGPTAATTTGIDLTSTAIVTDPDYYFRTTGFTSVAGSTATRIVSIASGTIQQNSGSGIQYLDDSTNGARFVATKAGTFTFQYSSDPYVSGGGGMGFSLNSANLTTAYSSLPAAEKLACTYDVGSGAITSVTAQAQLAVGDIVRIHADGALATPSASYSSFTISSPGKTLILNPSSDQKIEIPSSELRFEGSSARGSTDTVVVKFDTLAKIRGDAFSVSNTATNGTVVTVQKDGLLSGMASVANSQANRTLEISINQQTLTSVVNNSQEILAVSSSSVQGVPQISFQDTLVKKGDVIRVVYDGTPSSSTDNIFSLTLKETKIAVALSNVTPQFSDGDGYIDINTTNGFGSTYNKIYRWANIAQQDGLGKFTFVDSSTDGSYVQINETGIYNMWASASGPVSGSVSMCFTKNEVLATTGTTSGTNLTIAQGLIGMTYGGAPSGNLLIVGCGFNGKLNKGDIIRVHTDGQTNPNPTQAFWNITKVGKPSLTQVDVTPFLNIKASAGTVGEITTFATTSVPLDYLVCDGSAVSRTAYPDLFAAISTTHGSGDGSTTFNLPDYRGRFLRGLDATAGRDPDKASRTAMNTGGNTGNLVGSVQTDAIQGHEHAGHLIFSDGLSQGGASAANTGASGERPGSVQTDADYGTARVSSETRPTNASVVYGIRWRAANAAIVSTATSYRMSDYLANGNRVTGTAPANLGEYRAFTRTVSARDFADNAPSTGPSVSNGMLIYSVNGTSAGTSGQPNRWQIFIGKNKQFKVDFWANAGRTVSVSADVFQNGGATEEYGIMTSYDPTTGVLDVSLPVTVTSTTNRYVGWSQAANGTANSAITSAYFDVTVFDTPFVSFPRIAPTVTRLTSGSGTYTAPAGCLYFRVKMIGGGGGGANTTGTGGTGGTTTFGTSLLSCVGGSGGSGAQGGSGGTTSTSGGGYTLVASMQGNGGNSGQQTGPSQSGYPGSGVGGAGPWGGAGAGTSISAGGNNGAANSGAGGSGSNPGLSNNATSGGGGGAGGYIEAIFPVTSTISYPYSVGAGGAAGGSTGGSGVIIIEEHYR